MISERRGVVVSEIKNIPKMPESGAHLWARYLEIITGRTSPITYADIDAYQRVIGVNLLPLEIRTILKIDAERHKK